MDILHDTQLQPPEKREAPSLFKTTRQFGSALAEVSEAARHEVDAKLDWMDRTLASDPDKSLAGWSMRISADGIEVMGCPYEEWISCEMWAEAGIGYLHNFAVADTLAWLRELFGKYRWDVQVMIVDAVCDLVCSDRGHASGNFEMLLKAGMRCPAGRH